MGPSQSGIHSWAYDALGAYALAVGLDGTPRVLAVAVAFAEVSVVYVAGFAFEFEIRNPCWILVVEYTGPKWSQ
jgi:hypothetical protein